MLSVDLATRTISHELDQGVSWSTGPQVPMLKLPRLLLKGKAWAALLQMPFFSSHASDTCHHSSADFSLSENLASALSRTIKSPVRNALNPKPSATASAGPSMRHRSSGHVLGHSR